MPDGLNLTDDPKHDPRYIGASSREHDTEGCKLSVNRLVNRERSRRAAGPGEQMLVNMNSGFGDASGLRMDICMAAIGV